MDSRRTLFRLAAIAILLLGAAELLACEILSPAACEFSDSESGDDHCLCCCRHLAIAAPFALDLSSETVLPVSPAQDKPPSRAPAEIYHPPRD